MRRSYLRFDYWPYANSVFGWLALLLLLGIAPGFAAEPRFVPGELLLGYTTASDRDNAMRKLGGAKDALRVRGEKLEAVDVQPIADKGVKLRLTFPAPVLNVTRNNPKEEAAVLDDVARQLKEADKSVQYAHPNWIAEMQIRPPSQTDRSAPQASQRSPSRVAAVHHHHRRIHMARRATRHHHHIARKKDWWAHDHFWPFSFSEPCPTQANGHAHSRGWRSACRRHAMR